MLISCLFLRLISKSTGSVKSIIRKVEASLLQKTTVCEEVAVILTKELIITDFNDRKMDRVNLPKSLPLTVFETHMKHALISLS